jgi:hypothetical protein
MGAASAAISPLGLGLDIIEHRVLMCMRGGARRRTVALRMDGQSRRRDGHAREESGCKVGGATTAMAKATGGRRRRMGSTPTHAHLFISRVHQIRPLRLLPPHDVHYKGNIPIISREDHTRLFAGRASNDLSSEFRSSANTKRHQVTEMTTRLLSPHITLT